MQLDLEGRVALVTGASRGIGFAIARELADAGATVMLSARNTDALEKAAAELGARNGNVVGWQRADVADTADAKACVAETVARFGGLDVLVNNAGTNPHYGPLVDTDEDLAERTVQVNQQAVIRWTGAAWRAAMRERGGAVLNIAAISGLDVYPNCGWYAATKAAIIHMTRQLAYELAPGVRVNTIAPGVVETGFAEGLVEEYGDRLSALAEQLPKRDPDARAAKLPLRRLGVPDDISRAALFLLSDAASWITGQTLAIDGGALAVPKASL
jgi:NAD(P)-dependent dehydrogenase (short-subunit alcohol dehydrogenase family)